MGGLDPAWIALIGTIVGSVGLKVLEHFLGKAKIKVDEASKIRDELRLEIGALRDEVNKLETEVNNWREKYLDLRDTYAELNTEYRIALAKLGETVATTEKAIDAATPK